MRSSLLKLFIVFLSVFPLGAKAQGGSCGSLFLSSESTLSLHSIENAGRGNLFAQSSSGEVFLKRFKGDSSREARWLHELNDLGLGIQIYGVHEIAGTQYLVLEKFPGINTQFPMLAPSEFKINSAMISEIQRQVEVLVSQKIIPTDLQFQISTKEKSIKIIDPELFRRAESREIAEKEAQLILRNLLTTWALEGKIE